MALAEQLIGRLRTMGLQPRAAVSDTVAAAWAFAHADQHLTAVRRRRRQQRVVPDRSAEWRLPVIIIPPGQMREYLNDLPVPAGRLHPDDVDILQQLGISTLKRTLQLPLDDLPTRLSADALTRIRQLLGDEEESIIPLPESDPIQARWTSESAAHSQSAIRQVLDHLCTRLSEQLIRRRTGATRLKCVFSLEDSTEVSLTAEFVRPVQTADVMRDMLVLRLESATIGCPVTAASVHAVICPLPAARQKDLFSSTEHIRPQEDLAVLLNRVNNRLGHRSALRAQLTEDARPEFAARLSPVTAEDPGASADRLRQLVTPEQPDQSRVPRYRRPTRLLARPVPVDGLQDDPVSGTFRFEGHTESIVEAAGPERLQTAWWDDSPVHRDYYRVRTAAGSAYWLFRQIRTGRWYLHGVFD